MCYNNLFPATNRLQIKQNKTKQNKTKQDKIKQDKTKQDKTKPLYDLIFVLKTNRAHVVK